MSSLSSAINSISGVLTTHFGSGRKDSRRGLLLGKGVAAGAGILGIGVAIIIAVVMSRTDWNILDLSGRVNDVFVGPIAVLFFGGILFRRVGPQAILLGFFLAASVSLFVSFSKEWFGMERAISWMWGIPFSFTLGMIVAGLGGFLFRRPLAGTDSGPHFRGPKGDMRIGPCLLVLALVVPGDGLPAMGTDKGVAGFTDRTQEAGIDFRHYKGSDGVYHLLEIMGSGAAVLDFDGDGYLDLFVVAGSSIPPRDDEESRSRLYRNRRNGTFQDVTRSSGLLIRTYGMGGGGRRTTTNDGGPRTSMSPGIPGVTSSGTRVTAVSGTSPERRAVENSGHWGSSAGFFDYDRDGLLDLFVCNYVGYDPGDETPCHTAGRRNYCHPTTFETDASVLYRNLGNGTFQDRSTSSGIGHAQGKALGVAFTDLEPDGYPEVFVANDTVADFLFRNNRDGTFQEVGFDQGVALDENGHPRAGMGVDFGDYDGDGRMDLLVTNFADEGTPSSAGPGPTSTRSPTSRASWRRATSRWASARDSSIMTTTGTWIAFRRQRPYRPHHQSTPRLRILSSEKSSVRESGGEFPGMLRRGRRLVAGPGPVPGRRLR